MHMARGMVSNEPLDYISSSFDSAHISISCKVFGAISKPHLQQRVGQGSKKNFENSTGSLRGRAIS